MSSAVLRIQVATLSDVPDGESRVDGVPNQVVTLRSVGSGTTHEVRFWDVANPGIGTPLAPSVPTISPVGDGRTYTFTPPGGASGYGQTFGIELIVDRGIFDDTGRSLEVRSRRIYAIPTERTRTVLPVFGEGADPQAALYNHGPVQLAASADNAGGNWRGYAARLLSLIALQDLHLGVVDLTAYPQSPPSGPPHTTETHVATVELEAGTLYQIGADIGDLSNGAESTRLIIRKQSDASLLHTMTVTQLKVWATEAVNIIIPARAAYEVYVKSSSGTGIWAVKQIRFRMR